MEQISSELVLKPNGSLCLKVLLKNEKGLLETKESLVKKPLYVLGHSLQLDPGVTLRSVFRLLSNNKCLVDITRPHFSEQALEYFKKECQVVCVPTDYLNFTLAFTENTWVRLPLKTIKTLRTNSSSELKEPLNFSHSWDLVLIDENDPTVEPHSVSFLFEEILDIPFKVLGSESFLSIVGSKRRATSSLKQFKEPGNSFSLFKFLDSVLGRICFFGPPEETAQTAKELKEQINILEEIESSGNTDLLKISGAHVFASKDLRGPELREFLENTSFFIEKENSKSLKNSLCFESSDSQLERLTNEGVLTAYWTCATFEKPEQVFYPLWEVTCEDPEFVRKINKYAAPRCSSLDVARFMIKKCPKLLGVSAQVAYNEHKSELFERFKKFAEKKSRKYEKIMRKN